MTAGEPAGAFAARACRVVPGGASTGSKRPATLYGSALAPDLPTHARRAWGCRLETVDGRELVDCTMALGAVAFGYADPDVTAAVQRAAAEGPVQGLAAWREVELAERLVAVMPGAEMVRFLRTGAEATAAAVRIARAATGRRTVLACGYFGWHDWSNPGPGVPPGAHADVRELPFDDTAALDRAVDAAGDDLAALIVEPLIHGVASAAWLAALRRHADARGAVLIFDEIKTAFRVRTAGVQALRGIRPDLTTLGKALANGYALAALVGARALLETPTWISSTLAGESTALAAAAAVLDRHAREDVCTALAGRGQRLRDTVAQALAGQPTLGVRVDGPAVMWRLVADDERRLDALVAEVARRGVLLKRGAYQFAALAHDAAAIDRVGAAVHEAAAALVARAPDRLDVPE
jgi:glutamate-1-semialdehyde 2,1-aminomutase